MATRWHMAEQKKIEKPLTSAELRELARNGKLQPTHLVRAHGMTHWVPAEQVVGLFLPAAEGWYYTHWGKKFGPVSGRLLKRLAKVGMLETHDKVWREGFREWTEASRVVGLFSRSRVRAEMTTHLDRRATPAPRHSTAGAGSREEGGSRALPENPRPRRTTRRIVGSLGVLALIATAAAGAMLNSPPAYTPPSQAHRIEPQTPPLASTAGGGAGTVDGTKTDAGQPPQEAASTAPVLTPSAEPVEETVDLAGLGREIHRRVLRDYRVETSPALQARLEKAAARLLPDRESAAGLHFIVLDTDAVYAFSHVGGYVYVTRGIFSLVAGDVELAWVVGHELAHVLLDHAVPGPTNGTPDVEAAYREITRGHIASQEFAADEWVTRRLLELGHTRREALWFLKRYRNYLAQNAHDETAPSDAQAVQIDRVWRSLPTPELRLNQLENISQPSL